MIPIRRASEPARLIENKKAWTDKFQIERDKNPSARPRSGQYAHNDIREALESSSHHKCFYCEQKLGPGTKGEVDHYIGIEDDSSRAFEWSNLYLSCKGCNNAKKGRKDIQLSECLNPCDPAVQPEQHLQFDDQQILPKNNSELGRKTIAKFALDRDDLDHLRLIALKELLKAMVQIKDLMIQYHRFEMDPREKEILQSFACEEHAFSLMFQIYLQKLKI